METKTAITRLLSVLAGWRNRDGLKKGSRISFTINPASSMFITFMLAIMVYFCALQPTSVRAQISADASVNGKLKTIIQSKQVKPGVNGVSIAAGKIFNPVKEEYRVSRKPKGAPKTGELVDDGNKPANTDEVKNLQGLIDAIKGGILGTDALTTEIRDKTKPTDRPERFQEVSKKTFPLLAEIPDLSNPAALEEAEASAGMKGTLTGATFTLDGKSNPHTRIVKMAARNPMAVALAVDRDPLAVKWKTVSDQEITIDLSEVSLTAKTTGSMTSAFALFSSDMSFINNSLNINLSEEQAAPLYELLISFTSTNGDPPVLDVLLDAFENEISDSLGNVGIDDVIEGLMTQLTLTGEGSIGFDSSYSFTVTVPESPSKSVLFLRDIAVASVTAEEEPTPTPTPTPALTQGP
ncbi:MAG: hypothetical protein AB1598_05170 [Thermodesulfobacteriota bacterium]